mgnify:CR=1 FL=1
MRHRFDRPISFWLYGLALAVSGSVLEGRSVAVAQSASVPDEVQAVAVLPFENIAGDPADDWMGAGIAEHEESNFSQRLFDSQRNFRRQSAEHNLEILDIIHE